MHYLTPRTNHATLSGLTLLLFLSACGDDGSSDNPEPAAPAQTDAATAAATPAADAGSSDQGRPASAVTTGPTVVVADWLNHSLSFLDFDALADLGDQATREDVLVDTLELAGYEPGPLEVEITPDGKTALVSVSAGFFGGIAGTFLVGATVVADQGLMLFIDLESHTVIGELNVGLAPMGMVITADSSTALVTVFNTDELVVVDIAAQEVIERIDIGAGPEKVAIDDSGQVGIVNNANTGSFRTFWVDDIGGTLSEPVSVTGDSSGVAFFPGTTTALVIHTWNPLVGGLAGYSVIDVADPTAPVVVDTFETNASQYDYVVVAWSERGSLILPSSVSGVYQLQEIAWVDGAVDPRPPVIGPPVANFTAFGVAPMVGTSLAVTAVPGDQALFVTDMDGGSFIRIPWLPLVGPSYVAIH